jgi:hypothetical protein
MSTPVWILRIEDSLGFGAWDLELCRRRRLQGPLYLPTMTAWCVGAIVAGITKNERYHAFWAIFFLFYQIYYTTAVLLRLG